MAFLIGNLLDWLIGEPHNPYHPVCLIGRLATKTEKVTRKGLKAKLAGNLTWIFVMSVVCLLMIICIELTKLIPYASFIFECGTVYFCVSAKGLIEAGDEVVKLLRNDLFEARQALKMIVGRDTENLTKTQIYRAVIETCSENICDGIIAPMFYFALFGPVGMMLYKAVNTMDSMFGYRNDQYLEFGYCSAKMDDLFNFIPARLDSFIMILASFFVGLDTRASIKITCRDRLNHSSPNSGHSEASAAGALRIQLGGANTYFNKIVVKETIGDDLEVIDESKYQKMRQLLIATSLMMIMLVFIKELMK